MNNIMIKEDVSSMIIKIRGVDVILDSDIAIILGVETKVLNQSVKRNINKFNKNNYFQLDKEEFNALKSQFATSNDNQRSQIVTLRKYSPYVFTKEGILILTSILKVKNELIIELVNAFERQNLVIQNDDDIREMIYEIREKQVMLDFDLAYLYECKNGTKDINKAVKRNIERFPDNFMFQLSEEEFDNLRFQFGTSSLENNYGGRRYLPYAFTEQGVAMLSSVLHSQVAIKVSIKIMNAFVSMKKYIYHMYQLINSILIT